MGPSCAWERLRHYKDSLGFRSWLSRIFFKDKKRSVLTQLQSFTRLIHPGRLWDLKGLCSGEACLSFLPVPRYCEGLAILTYDPCILPASYLSPFTLMVSVFSSEIKRPLQALLEQALRSVEFFTSLHFKQNLPGAITPIPTSTI